LKIQEADKEGIDFFDEILSELLITVFDLTLAGTFVSDLSEILDFSITQEELDDHLDLIQKHYNINLRESKDYNILSLCRLIESKKHTQIH
jgi:hypothetical protein